MLTALDRILLLIVGAIFLGGGLYVIRQAINGAKNLIESSLFGLIGVATGLLLCIWAFFGAPE